MMLDPCGAVTSVGGAVSRRMLRDVSASPYRQPSLVPRPVASPGPGRSGPGNDLGPAWATLGRRPLPFETSIPGVFAVGDVHSGSMKRVAAATGEGASAIASVHKAIATLA